MTEDLLDYSKLVEKAMQSVMREALEIAASNGLPGTHHFYLTIDTTHPELEMPESIRKQHPDEITIVLENQFWDLEVGRTYFKVTLSFSGNPQRLKVPYDAISAFVDPSVKFGLQFSGTTKEEKEMTSETTPSREIGKPDTERAENNIDTSAEVVTLDNFRKKPD
ncbi:MAG: ClpXP protease specificity-enhancing factor SspB [Rhodospirillaceae bacterium]|jgi:hypothetical protein